MLGRFFFARLPLPLVLSVVAFAAGGALLFVFNVTPNSLFIVPPPLEMTRAAILPVIIPPPNVSAPLEGARLTAKRDELIQGGELFVEADLSEMKLRVWEAGQVLKEVPILTKGREGSWWETPTGLYKVQTKARNHFSSFGQVYQPWSMAFQGNFFIHGWPYYPGGEAVDSEYSGGCIRLDTADAKAVYNLVKVDTPVLILEKDFEKDDFIYAERRHLSVQAAAKSYLAVDLKNRFIFTEKERDAVLPIASVTKLMTALVAAEHVNLDKTIPVPESALVYTSVPRLKAGERYSAYQLLYPLLQESSNEAALTLAAALGRTRFVELMNQKAAALGMAHTRFEDPAGSLPGNVSTAADLFTLAQYLLNNRSFILKITSGTLGPNVYGPSEFKDLKNFNVFLGEAGFVGGKVGKTLAAEETILAIFNERLQGMERPVVVIVLASGNNGETARAIRDAVLSGYGQ